MRKNILVILVIFLSNLGIGAEEKNVSKEEFKSLKSKFELLEPKVNGLIKNGSDYITIIYKGNKDTKEPTISEKSLNIINIGSNKFGEDITEHYHSTVVGSGNKLKYINLEKFQERFINGAVVFGKDNAIIDGVVIGNDNLALGDNNFILGNNSKNYGSRSINLGYLTTTFGTDSIAAGFASKALKTDALALGGYSEAKSVGAIAIGNKAIAEEGIAIGSGSLANRSGGELGYFPNFKSMNRLDIAKELGKDKEYNEAIKVFKESEELLEKEKEYKSTLSKRDYYEEEINKLKENIVKYNKTDEKYIDSKNKIDKLKEEMKKNEEKSLELRKIVNTKNEKYNKLKKARSEYYNIFGAYSSTVAAFSVGNEEKGYYRQIIGVAAGSKDTDAVNVLQLKSLAGTPISFYNNGELVKNMPLSKLSFDFGKGLKVSEEEKDGKKLMLISIDNGKVENDINKLSGSASNNAAMLNIPSVSSNKLVSLGAGIGYASNSTSIALGLSGRDKNNKIIYKASLGLSSKGNFNAGAGINYSFGELKDKKDEEIEKLKNDNKQLKERLDKFEKILNNLIITK